jgi:hypothetical protein
MRRGQSPDRMAYPSTLQIVIWPEASKAQNNIAAFSADGTRNTVLALVRRLNSSCRHSIAFDARIDFHSLFGKRDRPTFQPLFAEKRLALPLDFLLHVSIDRIVAVGGDFVVQPGIVFSHLERESLNTCTINKKSAYL